MTNNKKKIILNNAYNNPTDNFCYFSTNNLEGMKKVLGSDIPDWAPQKTIEVEPWFWNTHTIPLAMGCEPTFSSEGKEWIKPMISESSQVKDIKIPDVTLGRTGEILNKMKQMKDELPEDTLIRMPDIQSPLGAAELIWDQSFYIALMTNPDEIHELLTKISEFIINYITEMKKIMGDRLNASCYPNVWTDSSGFYISDDANSMVSPEMHLEYSVDYINKLSEKLGPIYYHSCTFTEQYIENIKKIKNKKVINWSTEPSIDPAILIKEFSGTGVLAPQISVDLHKSDNIKNLNKNINNAYDLVKYMLDSMTGNSTLYLTFEDTLLNEPEIMKKIFNLMEEREFTPEQN